LDATALILFSVRREPSNPTTLNMVR
jgi:hypothetical protein